MSALALTRRAACLLLAALALPAQADLDALASDGLYTWQVPARYGAPAWCCLAWQSGQPVARDCDLDSQHMGFGGCDGQRADVVQVYAAIDNGEVSMLRALSPDCDVNSRRDIVDLGTLDGGDSVAWLAAQVTPGSEISEDALAAISVHAAPAALQQLMQVATDGATPALRKDGLFWFAQTGAAEGERVIVNAIRTDPSETVREDAVFALSQLPAERAVDALIGLVADRDLDRALRERALFWLADSDSDRAYDYLDSLLAGGRNSSR